MARLNVIEKTMCAADALRAMLVARWRVRPFGGKCMLPRNSSPNVASRMQDEAKTRCWLRSRNKRH